MCAFLLAVKVIMETQQTADSVPSFKGAQPFSGKFSSTFRSIRCLVGSLVHFLGLLSLVAVLNSELPVTVWDLLLCFRCVSSKLVQFLNKYVPFTIWTLINFFVPLSAEDLVNLYVVFNVWSLVGLYFPCTVWDVLQSCLPWCFHTWLNHYVPISIWIFVNVAYPLYTFNLLKMFFCSRRD